VIDIHRVHAQQINSEKSLYTRARYMYRARMMARSC